VSFSAPPQVPTLPTSGSRISTPGDILGGARGIIGAGRGRLGDNSLDLWMVAGKDGDFSWRAGGEQGPTLNRRRAALVQPAVLVDFVFSEGIGSGVNGRFQFM
jgi:hypothetical protein